MENHRIILFVVNINAVPKAEDRDGFESQTFQNKHMGHVVYLFKRLNKPYILKLGPKTW